MDVQSDKIGYHIDWRHTDHHNDNIYMNMCIYFTYSQYLPNL